MKRFKRKMLGIAVACAMIFGIATTIGMDNEQPAKAAMPTFESEPNCSMHYSGDVMNLWIAYPEYQQPNSYHAIMNFYNYSTDPMKVIIECPKDAPFGVSMSEFILEKEYDSASVGGFISTNSPYINQPGLYESTYKVTIYNMNNPAEGKIEYVPVKGRVVGSAYDDVDSYAQAYMHTQMFEHASYVDMRDYNIYLSDNEEDAKWMCEKPSYGVYGTECADLYDVYSTKGEYEKKDGVYFLKGFSVKYREGDYDRTAFFAARDEALSYVNESMSDFEKALILHDWLVTHCTYDNESFDNGIYVPDDYNAYGPLVYGKGVCEGYAMAYKYLLNQESIECYYVDGDAIGHAWDLVILDGQAYHVDPTWDDKVPDMWGQVTHDNFLMTDEEAVAAGHDTYAGQDVGWRVLDYGTPRGDLQAISKKYSNAFFRDVESTVALYDETFYYSRFNKDTGKAEICSLDAYDCLTATPKVLVADVGNWEGKYDEYNRPHMSTLVAEMNGRIYYNTRTGVSSIMPDGSDGKEEYRINDEIVYGVVRIGDKLYYTTIGREWILSDPIPFTDEDKVGNTSGGTTNKSGWKKSNNKWYYLNEKGEKLTGWQKISDKWYYFNNNDGMMMTGWQQIGGKWYYLGTSGAMMTGWQQISGKWYYLSTSGAMMTGWQQFGGKWYYFGAGGAMVTGWQAISGKWYYFGSSGAMMTGWQAISGKWYYFGASGAMMTGWQLISGKWYYFETSGAMTTGWKFIGTKWYYFETSGVMVTGTKTIDGKKYVFDSNGVLK